MCVTLRPKEFLLHAGGRVTTDTARPTKRVSVGAEAVEDAPLCTCIKRNDSTGFPCRCWFVSMVVLRMISPKTGFLSFGKVLVRLLNSSVLRTLAPYRSCSKGLMQ